MVVVPALDLKSGRAVRLVRGEFAREHVYARDAEEVMALARSMAEAGAGRLHLVDLDAAAGSGDNRTLVGRLVRETGLEVQVAGGVRSERSAADWLSAGAAAVVMGTTAVRQPELLTSVAAAHPGRVMAALDARAGRPAVAGWLEEEDLGLEDVLARWQDAPLRGVIVTSIDRDGTLAGPDVALLTSALRSTGHPVTYSGGIASLADLTAVAEAGADAVILGKSLLEGRFSLSDALSRWPQP